MLDNGLGSLIETQAQTANRVVDLFCGSGVVAWYASEKTDRQVMAADLQEYAVVLAGSVILRTEPLNADTIAGDWLRKTQSRLESLSCYADALHLGEKTGSPDLAAYVEQSRRMCSTLEEDLPISRAYGGYYFGPLQALQLEALRLSLPSERKQQLVALAALLFAASSCAASPGHTAQPFQPTATAGPYLLDAWRRDPTQYCMKALRFLCPRHARVVGKTFTRDALGLVSEIEEGDLVIVDPPYSDVQYSRFYHVLETIAHGTCGKAEGVGRYPPRQERPQSQFSRKTESEFALRDLLKGLRDKRASVILTFPSGESSNGLTGQKVINMAGQFFRIEHQTITGRFSTLGGNSSVNHRPARQPSQELILLLLPN